ncbi:hypothetical protein HHK36_008885 [Tetracentron sinense]|uniref:ZF-HD dimerization-type domain-containing protein n=1 Tax=Tetracentron sinense TaxID=13715 RepID=A0A834ZAT9_TETSI|nr:hypothetical protein HHK36_008885 [Tetracentron sinense]
MDLSSQEGEIPIPIPIQIPIPINSSYAGEGHGRMIHHDHPPPPGPPQNQNHIIPAASSNGPIPPSSSLQQLEDHMPSYKKMVRYRECLKNHAAAMGGNATDGCGEFMPSGEEGTLEALKCSACNCHRNFHRKEMEGDQYSSCEYYHHNRVGSKVIVGHHKNILMGSEALGYPTATPFPSRAAVPPPPYQTLMSYNMVSLPSESDEHEDGTAARVLARPPQVVKKRFRTKFTPEQKEKMLSFAEKVGWRIQKQEEGVVQQLCQEIGVKRRVLKVWMHNNKHNLAKKNSPSTT